MHVNLLVKLEWNHVSPRQRQFVATLNDKQKVVLYLQSEYESAGNDESKLLPKAFTKFPHIFKSRKYNNNYMKVRRWWDNREKLLSVTKRKQFTRWVACKRKIGFVKTLNGRGRKLQPWVVWIYQELKATYDRLDSADVPLTPSLLVDLAKGIIRGSDHRQFNFRTTVGKSKKRIYTLISHAWIHRFLHKHNLALREPGGRGLASPKKERSIRKVIAYHLGGLKEAFDSGDLDPSLQSNVDETHILIDERSGKILSVKGAKDVKLMDVVSGTEGVTIALTIIGGDKSAHVGAPMLIFKNKERSYPMRGVPDNVEGATYRTQAKAWMDGGIFKEYLHDQRTWGSASTTDPVVRDLWLDNASAHEYTDIDEHLSQLKTRRRMFPANTTDRLQPCDRFVIKVFKQYWRELWGQERMRLINEQQYETTRGSNASEKLKRPSRRWMLETAAKCVKLVNESICEKTGMTFAHKAMVQCGVGVGFDGKWKVSQLSGTLQKIVAEFPEYFNRERNPYGEDDEDHEEDSEDECTTSPLSRANSGEVYRVNFGGSLLDLSLDEYMLNLGYNRAAASRLEQQVRRRFDNESVSHAELQAFLREALPAPITLPACGPSATRLQYASKMVNSLRSSAEIHDIEVVHLMNVVQAAMRRSKNVPSLNFLPFHPSSPKANSIAHSSILRFGDLPHGNVGQVFYSHDHFELLVFNTELMTSPLRQKTQGSDLIAGVFHLDSAARGLQDVCLKQLTHLGSDMAKDLAASTGNSVVCTPAVLQPRGTRVCGVAACVNLLLASTCTRAELLRGGIEAKLTEFELPQRETWTRENWARAGFVLVNAFVKIESSNYTVESLLHAISLDINRQVSSAESFVSHAEKQRLVAT